MLVLASPVQAEETRLMRFPNINGDTVVFTYAGDLWVAKTSGGNARRLTSHPGLETRPKISPDGTMVAFTGSYDGNPEVYVVPIEGGEPKRLTYEAPNDNVLGWTPDGRIAFASTAGMPVGQQRLWIVNPQGGLPIRTPIEEITEASYIDSDTIAYTRVSSYNFNWRRYRGGTQGRISLYKFSTNSYSELPAGREQNYFPMVVGGDIYYVSDKNLGTLNLYKYNLASKRETQLTKYSDADIRWPSTDGKNIVWERNGYLNLYDVATGGIKSFSPKIPSENLQARPYLRNLANQIGGGSLSPSGARVVVEARGELFSVPVKAGDTRNMTQTSTARERFPAWSPDGQTIAYVSDATGEYEVYTMPQLGGDAKKLTSGAQFSQVVGITWSPDGKMIAVRTRSNELWLVDAASGKSTRVLKSQYGFADFDFSPDSKWIAICDRGKNLFASLWLYEVATGKLTQITKGEYDDSQVTFDLNGKYLYLVSTRSYSPAFGQFEFSLKVTDADRIYVIPLAADTGNPLIAPNEEEPEPKPQGGGAPPESKPAASGDTKIDLAGMGDRMVPLPMGPTSYRLLLGVNNGVLYMNGPTLSKFDMGSRESQTIISGVAGIGGFNQNRTKMVYIQGGNLFVTDIRPGLQPGQGRVDTSAVEAVIDPRDEWRQIFWEAWRFERDNFYDPGMRGVDWKAVGDKYAKYLQYVNHRTDLNYVLGLMLGELGTGHAYVSGGDTGPMGSPIPIGQLGVDYEISGNYVRLKKIYKGWQFDETRRGPLSEPGVSVKEGDYLLEIDGKPVTSTVHPGSLLLNKVGRFVTLTVNDRPTTVGARKVRVRPIANESQLRYTDWVEDNKRYVEKMSGGRIGYMHIPNTATEGAIEFIRGFYSQTDKDAMIVDERWNGGGFIQPWFVDTLARKMKAGIQQRNAQDVADSVAIEGPKVMLINQYAGSGGDFFPWMFRQQKLGPLIGKRTWGGLVGISGGAPLVDGGSVTAPEFSIYNRETGEIIAENTGVDPDIDVDLRPDLVAVGRDPQLEKAVEVLLEQLKKLPPKKERTTIPPVGKQGRVGG
jgi:tricorn protease